MKSIALVFLVISSLLFVQAAEPGQNQFTTKIEDVDCVVKAYSPLEPIVFSMLVNKDSLPKSQLMISIMLTNSDITSYMTDEMISQNVKTDRFDKADLKAEYEKMRAGMKKRSELTGPDAEDSPWKGMKYALDQVFIIESKLGKYLVYQLSPQGTKEVNGRVYSIRKHEDGRWLMSGTKDETIDKFKQSLTSMIPKEFEKLQKESAVATLPLEELLK
ncbi:MAG: hypothetical protein ACK46A_12535 [Akkermansiaceae bacterium]|jgi:hypothetical protein|nr:hypothetical protein [Luteolibacter sp.]